MPWAWSSTRRSATPSASGEPLCTLLVNDESRLPEAAALIREAYTIGRPALAAAADRRADRGGASGCREADISDV